MTAPEPGKFTAPAGIIALTTHGSVRAETYTCLSELRSQSEKAGLSAVQYLTVPGSLVDKARNDAVRALLKSQCGWLMFIDADMTFQPDALHAMLATAYASHPHADILSGYCNLRGELALPTMDTGTGTWESWFPGSGVVEVIRTGAAFLLVKRHVFEGLSEPWFRLRVPARPIDFMAEIDNFARMKFDGRNPLRGLPSEVWEKLEQCAKDDPSIAAETFVRNEVGEDSGFCDRAKHAGFRIFVNTDIVTGHVDTEIRDWKSHKKAIAEIEKTNWHCVGVEA